MLLLKFELSQQAISHMGMWGKFAETRKAHEVKIKRLEDAAVHYICQVEVFFDRFFDVASKKVRRVRKDINCEKGS